MKKLFLFLFHLIFLTSYVKIQSKTTDAFLDNLTSEIARNCNILSKTLSSYASLPHDTCLDKKFSVVFYLIQDSAYTLPNNPTIYFPQNAISSYSLTDIINKLNEAFARICVSFENCKTVIIPNYSYNLWTVGTTDSVVIHNWYTENTINIYIPSNVLLNPQPNHLFAYTSNFPGLNSKPRDFLVLKKGLYLIPNGANFNGSNLLHAMGHFFGLPHTYADISSPASPPYSPSLPNGPSSEAPDGSNCLTNGDGFCDTEADSYPVATNIAPLPQCGYQYSSAAQLNGIYYLPPVDNVMSNYNCRCRFTQEQYNYMVKMILTKRLYLH